MSYSLEHCVVCCPAVIASPVRVGLIEDVFAILEATLTATGSVDFRPASDKSLAAGDGNSGSRSPQDDPGRDHAALS